MHDLIMTETLQPAPKATGKRSWSGGWTRAAAALFRTQSTHAATHAGFLRADLGAVLIAAALLLTAIPAAAQEAEEKPVKPPSVKEENIQIKRGRDIVQIPNLWYQEGTEAPDSIGVLRVARPTSDPDAVTYPDVGGGFPVNLQLATFVRDGQIAELPISQDVIDGEVTGRIIIRPPVDDYYDIAEPYGVEPIKQVPGEETIVDAREWYEAALYSPVTRTQAPDDRFHNTRELRGRLRSTARGGESVYFYITASRELRPQAVLPPTVPATYVPPATERVFIPEARTDIRFEVVRPPNLDWITTTAVMAGPNRADIPSRDGQYEANRIKGDVTSTLRWRVDNDERYEVTFYGSTNATVSDNGSHNDVPYGLSVAARFGKARALELRAEAGYEDDPFQAQTFGTGDERLRVLFGYDRATPRLNWRLSLGPTYFRDRQSSWERSREDARELGLSARASLDRRFRAQARFPLTLGLLGQAEHTWGYIRDAGNSNLALSGRISLKPSFSVQTTEIMIGPVAYIGYTDSEYAEIAGFSEFNAQFGVEATTKVRF